jgi:hypothetical protein
MPDNNYNPAPDQPLVVFFELNIGGLSKIFKSPDTPIALEFDLNSEGDGSVKISLFDETGLEVEPAIWQAQNENDSLIPEGTIQFGYQGTSNVVSQVYPFQVESYTLDTEANSMSLVINGTILYDDLTSTNQYSGTINKILQDLCADHKMTLNIDPEFGDFYMQDTGYTNKDSTALGPMIHMKWSNESDQAFLRRLVYWARDGEGKGGYRVYKGTDGSGNTVLNIVKCKNTSANYTYTVQTPESVVLKWSPGTCFASPVWNTNEAQQHTYQRITGYTQKIRCDQDFTKQFQTIFGNAPISPLINAVPVNQSPANDLTFFNSEVMDSSVTGSACRSRPGPSTSPYAGVNPFLNSHLTNWMDCFDAELTVLGDPTLDPVNNGALQTVQVNYYYPKNYNPVTQSGQLHHTSGTYYFEGVRHSIHEGSFETTLSLTRATCETPDTSVQEGS